METIKKRFIPKDINTLYILGNVNTQKILCSLKLDEHGKVKETNYDGTWLNHTKTMAQWIITSGDCAFPGNTEKLTYLLVEAETVSAAVS